MNLAGPGVMHGMVPGPLQHDPSSGMVGGYQDPQQQQQHGGNNNNQMVGSGLPPMSTFRNTPGVPVQPGVGAGPGAVQSPSLYNHSPSLGPVVPGPPGQTSGDALGKALASVSYFYYFTYYLNLN